jgi:serine/threonine protein kinase
MTETMPGPGRVVAGRYRLAAELGRGGMGVVWQADDTLIGRQVAVKELRSPAGLPAAERDTFTARALAEARNAARVHHANAVALYDVLPASAADEAVYLIMELVPAPTLADVVTRDGPLAARRVAGIGLQLLDVLDAAHALGVVHRDVKPANILLAGDQAGDQAGDRAKLADFGIARGGDDPRLTRSGVIVGTQAYLAPELFESAPVTPAADLWSLGATLHCAAEGKGPFDRQNTGATLRAILVDDIPAPACAPPLATAITALLTRDPGQRATSDQVRPLLQAAAASPNDSRTDGSRTESTPRTDPPRTAPPRADWEQQATTQTPAPGGSRVSPLMDPAHAADLLAEAARTGRKTHNFAQRVEACVQAVEYLSHVDPARAEQNTHVFGNWYFSARLLVAAAGGLVASDPGRASEMLTEAERRARRHTRQSLATLAAIALSRVAGRFAEFEPARARRLLSEAEALKPAAPDSVSAFAVALATLDAGRAEALAREITNPVLRARTLVRIAARLIRGNPVRASALLVEAQREHLPAIDNAAQRDQLLADIVGQLAIIDLPRAEEAVGGVHGPFQRARALASVAGTLALLSPDRARRYLDEGEQAARSLDLAGDRSRGMARVARELGTLDLARARTLLTEAETLLTGVRDPRWRATATSYVAACGAGIPLNDW